MTVTMLIQIDKLVQLLESPVFTYLRLQLLEPERFPHLYKCLYGVLMLLPQSSAFAALKNRLNSVSAIGYLHIAPRTQPSTPGMTTTFGDRPNRLKSREDPSIKWTELLEKFRATQEKGRRAAQRQQMPGLSNGNLGLPAPEEEGPQARTNGRVTPTPGTRAPVGGFRPGSAASGGQSLSAPLAQGQGNVLGHQKGKSSLSQLGRFARVPGKSKRPGQ